MSKNYKSWMQILVVFIVTTLIITGCQKKTEEEKSGKENPQQQNQPNTSDNPVEIHKNGQTAETQAEEIIPEIDIMSLAPLMPQPDDPRKILENVVKSYKNSKSYADQGYFEFVYIDENNQQQTTHQLCSFVFQKPNQVRMEMNMGKMVSDGKFLFAHAGLSKFYNQVVEKHAPKEMSIKELYGDMILSQMMQIDAPPEVIFLPPQIVLLFAQNPLLTLVPDDSNVQLRLPEYLLSDDRSQVFPCDRIDVTHKLTGKRTYWIERETNTLLRMEISVDHISSNQKIKPVSIKFELVNALLDPDPMQMATFEMQKPTLSAPVSELLPPEMFLLGRRPENLTCLDQDRKSTIINAIGQKEVSVVLLFVSDPQASQICRTAMEILQNVANHYANNKKVKIFPVSVDTQDVADNTIAETLQQWEITLPFFRQSNQALMKELNLTDVPTFLIFGQEGNLQLVNTEVLSAENITMIVDSALAGNEPQIQIRTLFNEQVVFFKEMMDNAVRYDTFYTESTVTEIAEPTLPQTFQLKELWKRTDYLLPNNPHVIGPYLFIPHDFQKISAVSSDGKDLKLEENQPATVIPKGISEEMPLHFLRSAKTSDAKWYLTATGINQKQLFILDGNMNTVASWPDALEMGKYEIAAVQMTDLNGDGIPEIVAGCRLPSDETGRIVAIDITGKKLWEVKSSEPDQVVIVFRDKTPFIWTIERGYESTDFAEFSAEGVNLRKWSPESREGLLWKLFADDLDSDGNSEVLAVLANPGQIFVAGVNTNNGTENSAQNPVFLWQNQISPGSPGVKSFDFVTSGNLLGDSTSKEWCVASADSTISFFDKSGKLLDKFVVGKLLSGMATARWNDDVPVLILSTNEDQVGGSPSENSVFAYQITVQEQNTESAEVPPQSSSEPESKNEAEQNSSEPTTSESVSFISNVPLKLGMFP
ncbi:MAG: thioredoxin family protein [Planctomycetaceae bacterium]|jgi:PBP1b-binding outer membrane lipoprotein LpoB/thiol-disulfide isomerase/thioredoxin|nr:thioredoxin family protein [Planctomycetaceae bacterium]